MYMRITQAVRAEIIEMHNGGLTPAEIVAETSVSIASVYKVLRAADLVPNKSTATGVFHKMSPEDVEDLLDRYQNSNETVADICASYGLHYNQLYEILKLVGVQPRTKTAPAKKARAARMDHAVRLYTDTNATIKEITLETGVHQPTLHMELSRRGIPLRQPRIMDRPDYYTNLRDEDAPLTPEGGSDE